MVRGICTVCASPNATNYHFGAQSCKACAAFFRRSIAMGQSYDCTGDARESCKIDHRLRLNCRHCRLDKCLTAGMLKDLVQAKRDPKPEKKSIISAEIPEVFQQPNTSDYFSGIPCEMSEMSENEWNSSPPHKKSIISDDLMGIDEFQQFFLEKTVDFLDFSPKRARIDSFNSDFSISNGNFLSFDEEERIYSLVSLYIELVINLNARRRIIYTDKMLGTVFDGACVCPYEKSDLKLFDHRTYRQKNRNDYTMILDYINRFPEFQLLTKSEKTVLFRTAAAVDVLVDQAYYSQVIFPKDDVMVTANGEYMNMDLEKQPILEKDSGNFQSDEDYDKYKALTQMKRRQWFHVVEPFKKLQLSLPEFALFKALTIWHYNYYKLQENGRQVCCRQRNEIFRAFLIICDDEGHEDALLRASEIVLAVGNLMAELHEMITSYIEIMVLDVLDDPILKDMLKFQY